ncbi:MAG: BLUF domain-containing protein [Polyangiaceae bacterium]
MSKLIHCIYASSATDRFEEFQIPAILDQARSKNERIAVTGMLLYIERSFFQVIEGAPDAIDALYARIAKDPRHHRLTQIVREPIAQRAFGDWSMGFANIALSQAGELTGANDFFAEASCMQRLTPGRAKKLLAVFGGGRWRTERTGQFATPGRSG